VNEKETKDEFKKPFLLRLQEALNDTDVLRNIKTVIIFIIAFGVPILYFGFFDSLSLERLFTWRIVVLSILAILLVAVIRIDTKSRAFDDEILTNKVLNDTERNVYIENKKIKNHLLGHKYVITYNIEQQKLADEMATEKRKNILNQKKAQYEINGKTEDKKYIAIIKELADLEKHLIRGKYSSISYDDLYSLENKKKDRSSQARANLRYNPKAENAIATITGILTKGATIGGAGALPFVWNAGWKTILIFYGTFLVTIIYTVLKTYIKVRVRTGKKYLKTREFRLDLLVDCNAFIAENEKKLEPTIIPIILPEKQEVSIEVPKDLNKEAAKDEPINLPKCSELAKQEETIPISPTGGLIIKTEL